ncbi:hypothetical protein ACVINY_005062 [Sinorhizobium meliloti]
MIKVGSPRRFAATDTLTQPCALTTHDGLTTHDALPSSVSGPSDQRPSQRHGVLRGSIRGNPSREGFYSKSRLPGQSAPSVTLVLRRCRDLLQKFPAGNS